MIDDPHVHSGLKMVIAETFGCFGRDQIVVDALGSL
jgi:hypothetical protein